MRAQHPLVTVVVPTFNAAATIRRAIDSVLEQTFHDYEVIVIDDASADATADIVATSFGQHVTLLRQPRNLGTSGAMNAGIAAARGEFVAFLDADDEWLPQKLAKQVELLERYPAAVMVACGCRFINRSGKPSRDDRVASLPVAAEEVWRLLLARTLIAKPCVVARADALRRVGPFDTTLAVGEDQDMWIRLALVGGVLFIPETLALVHDTAGSLTKIHADKIDRYVLPMIGRHIEAQRHRLSAEEIGQIWGERYISIGRNLYTAGWFVRGAIHIMRGVLRGYEVGPNIWYLLVASRAMKAVKQRFRRRVVTDRRGLTGDFTI